MKLMMNRMEGTRKVMMRKEPCRRQFSELEEDGLTSTLIYENSKYKLNLTVYVLKDANVDHHIR